MKPLRDWLRTPRYQDPELQLRATVLHRLSVTVFLTVTPLALLLPVVETTYRYSLPIYATSVAAAVAIYGLLHVGYARQAAVLFAMAGLVVTVWASWAVGGIRSPQLSMAVLVIMLVAFMWSGSAAIWMAALVSLSLAAVELIREWGLAPEPFISATRFTTWAALSSVLALSAVLLQMFVRQLRAARDEAAEKSRRLEEEMERRVQTEASLQRAQKLEALGRLSGGIAHDFNNVLTVLLGESELLESSARRGERLSSREIEQIAEMRASTERAAAMTRQLLAFSRNHLGNPEVVDPDESVERLEPMLERLIREDVRLEILPGAGGARVRIDPGQLDQIVMNLVLNASDAMPRGGELVVATERVVLDEASGLGDPNARPGPHVRIHVRDSGIGIRPEDLDRIFDPFFTTKGMGRGTGLGLASTHGIVSQCGGHIRVESEPGRGTTFQVFLPEVSGAEEREAATAEATAARPVGASILLCEDEESVRRILRRSLAAAGHRVFEVEDAEAALRWLEQTPESIDLLVTDVILPGRSGVDLARALNQERPGVPVLLISGYTANVLEGSGVRPDVELLQKPFTAEVLLARVAALLKGTESV